jgi:hypothetical protein
MTHLTAIIAAAAPGSTRMVNQIDEHQHPHRVLAHRRTRRARWGFCSPAANFLELNRAASHYPVIGGYAMITLALGLTGRHIPHDTITAPNLRGNAAATLARAGEE